MREPPPFVAFVLDGLSGIEDVRARSMFGGTGLYCGSVFFGIIYQDVLYLKVNDVTRAAYVRAGMNAFKPYADRPMTFRYYQVPVAILESSQELVEWARRAIDVAATREPKSTGRRKR